MPVGSIESSAAKGQDSGCLHSKAIRSESFRYSLRRQPSTERCQTPTALQLRFFRNGDRFHNGLMLVVSLDKYRHFQALLNELSEKLQLPSGAVRYVFRADDGKAIEDVTEFEVNSVYVGSTLPFLKPIPGGYGRPAIPNRRFSMNAGSASTDPSRKTEENQHRNFIKPKVITVIKTGKPPVKKTTYLLNCRTAASLETVLDQLSSRGVVGKVDRLCTLRGRPVLGLRDLFFEESVFIALQASEKLQLGSLDPIFLSFQDKSVDNLNQSTNSLRSTQPNRPRKQVDQDCDRPKSMCPELPMMESCRDTGKASNRCANPKLSSSRIPASQVNMSSETITRSFSMRQASRDPTSFSLIYNLGRVIGDGNFAVVRHCTSRKDGSAFAVKIIEKERMKGREQLMQSEIAIMSQLRHPNIVRLIEYFDYSRKMYLVMQLVEGGDLFTAISSSVRFTETDASCMISALSSAVDYLHSMKIVHRDIKPENLLVVRKEERVVSLKLADFGLASYCDQLMDYVCGTPTYVAPEVLQGNGYGLKVDVWSIGIITFILLCGYPPFRTCSGEEEELFELILSGVYSFEKPYWDTISNHAKDFIQRLLVVDENKRISAAETLRHPWITSGGSDQLSEEKQQLSETIPEVTLRYRRLCFDLPENEEQVDRIIGDDPDSSVGTVSDGTPV